MFEKIGFIGCGNMGGTLARAVASGGAAQRMLLSDHQPEKAEGLAGEIGACAADNERIARECGLIFLGVKPQMLPGLLAQLGPILAARTDRFVLVSMAAGITISAVRAMAGGEYPTIRIMPGVTASVGAGMTQFCAEEASGEELDAFCALLSPAGQTDELPEALIDAASAVASCGIAYLAMVLEAMADGGVACGLPRDKALRYAAQTMYGTAALTLESGLHPGQIKDMVCSPAGSTIEGVDALEQAGLRAALTGAVRAAYRRSLEMKEGK